MSDDVFKEYSGYYDLLYRDKDYAAEATYVGGQLRAAVGNASRILEFGSGTGRHGRLLAQQGFHVVGVDRSSTMVAVANGGQTQGQTGSGTFRSEQGDLQTVSVGGTFDAVIALFHVVSYQTDNAALTRTFANASRHLVSGGVFLFDVWHGPSVLAERPAVRLKQVEGPGVRISRVAEPALDSQNGIVTVNYTMFVEPADAPLITIREQHRMRYLFPTEVDLLAGPAGFTVERSEEFLSGHASSERTWGVMYVLRKR